ncbi:flagellin [Neorhizobium sp. SOG26]|jgi:Flagellin and related hook-associated proteins|uniref:flagellin N-terminal helical domain-containing protein n=1 Tax=Neorhizobium sp. SOG26 TaxID=2060726 RepID=UPI000E595CF3|nr:flagellin [Neorhizobium sp. SOG26]AXV16400.1 flagellin [Neorhizobium sp. SOG26]
MASILTNNSALTALSTLRSISQEMERTQNRISSGYRVETASDNSAYWSIATTMRSDNKALGTVKDALGLGAATTDVAYTALESSISVVDEIKQKITAASQPGVDKGKIQKEIDQLQEQLISIAKSASFSGQNWVYHQTGTNTAGTQAIVGSFNRDNSGNISLTTLEYNTGSSSLIAQTGTTHLTTAGILTKYHTVSYTNSLGATVAAVQATSSIISLDITSMGADLLSLTLAATESALKEMTNAAADIGAVNKRIDLQKNFVQDLNDSIASGISKLVDADMNEESTRLKALQTQQQLGIQALSIANSDSQNILALFR